MKKLLLTLTLILSTLLTQAQSYGKGDLISFSFTDEYGGHYEISFEHNTRSSGLSLYPSYILKSFRFLYMEVGGQRYTKSQVQSILDRQGVYREMDGERERYVFRPDDFVDNLVFKIDGMFFKNSNGREVCSISGPLHLTFFAFGDVTGRSYQWIKELEQSDSFSQCIEESGDGYYGEVFSGGLSYDYGNSENSPATGHIREYIIRDQQSQSQRPRSYTSRPQFDEEINGFFTLGVSGNLYDVERTPGLENSPSFGGVGLNMNIEHTSFLTDDRSIGLSYGFLGQVDFMGDNYERYEITPHLGFTFFDVIEIDYVFRGLQLSGTASGEDLNTGQMYNRDLGGDLQFHGGFRSSIYFTKDEDEGLIARGSFIWVDSRADSPINFLAFGNDDGPQTQSMTIRLEAIHNGILLYLYYSTESYISNETVPFGLDTFGFGLNYGILWPNTN